MQNGILAGAVRISPLLKLNKACCTGQLLLSQKSQGILACGLHVQRHFSHSYDKGENNSEVVYIGALRSTVKIVKGFSLTTSAIGLGLQPFLFQHLLDKPLIVSGLVLTSCAFFVLLTPLMLHFIAKRYVIEMSFNSATRVFTAKTLTLFNSQKTLTFTASDVKVPEMPLFFTTFSAKDVPLFIEPSLFQDADALEHLMGYDKPLDLHLNTEKSFTEKASEVEK